MWIRQTLIVISAAILSFGVLHSTPSAANPIREFDAWLTEWNRDLGAEGGLANAARIADDITFLGLDMVSTRFELEIEIGRAKLLGVAETTGGGDAISADGMELEEVRIRFGDVELVADELKFEKISLPTIPARPMTGRSKFERKFDLISNILRAKFARMSSEEVLLHTYADGSQTERLATARHSLVELTGFVDGELALLRVLGSIGISPPVEPMMTEKTGQTLIEEISIDRVLSLLDGEPSQSEQAIFKRATMVDYELQFGGIDLALSNAEVTDLKLRPHQAALETEILATFEADRGLDAIDEERLGGFLLDLAALPHVGGLTIENLRLATLGVERFEFEKIAFGDLSIAKIGQFALNELGAEIVEVGRFDIGKLAFAELVFPDVQILRNLIAGEDTPTISLLPQLASVEMRALELDLEALELSGGLGLLVVTQQKDRDTENLNLQLGSLRIPAFLIPSDGPLARVQGILASLEEDTLELDQELNLVFDRREKSLEVSKFSTSLAKLGTLRIDANLVELEDSPFDNPQSAINTVRRAALGDATIKFENGGAVEAAFDAQAANLGTSGETLRNQVGVTLPFLLGVLQNPPFQQQLVTALQAFLPDPQALQVKLNPASPVKISDLEDQLRRDPRKLIDMLATTVENTSKSPDAQTEIIQNSPDEKQHSGVAVARDQSPEQLSTPSEEPTVNDELNQTIAPENPLSHSGSTSDD